LLRQLRGLKGDSSLLYGPELTEPAFNELFTKGETGLWEWKKEEGKPCSVKVEIKKKKVHPRKCRHCAGKKRELRRSEEAPCLCCSDGKISCHVCDGSGRLIVSGTFSSGSPASCAGCGGKGQFKCTICKSKRVVPFARIGGKKIRDAKYEDIKTRLKELKKARSELLEFMRESGPVAVAKSRKLKSKIKYSSRHVSLMAKLQKRQGQMNGFEGGGSFTGTVQDRFIKMIKPQIESEVRLLEFAIERFEKNKKIIPIPPKVPASKK
jgi:hypothetical protein